eukprot:NODE_6042_length_1710_cov_18.679722.p1 GENE.NODE_6042_length_1710_cov_18.679722~~NODE_6042_length_1710_cov_18.679722.p1  ORF type:complete len:547 (+),score=107.10 NODE_6042_length_1710_cov_18.679722:44-1642(+)
MEPAGSSRTIEKVGLSSGPSWLSGGTFDHTVTELHMVESVYDAAFIIALYRGRLNNGGWTPRWISMLNMTLMLFINACLQTCVLVKIKSLSDLELLRVMGDIEEVCPAVLDNATGATYFDCAPAATSLMRDVRDLDLNHDGFWGADEARMFQEDATQKTGRAGHLEEVFLMMMDLARHGDLIHQQRHPDRRHFQADTHAYTLLPMQWLILEQGRLDMCTLTDMNICGNMKASGVLDKKLSYIDVDRRIVECQQLQDTGGYCERVFGEKFKFYVERTQRICGTGFVLWNTTSQSMITLYEQSNKYYLNSEGVSRMPYCSFLALVLTIWMLFMLVEVRRVVIWWLVLIRFPSNSLGEPVAVQVEDQTQETHLLIRINAIPLVHKVWTAAFNVLPRTAIVAGLAVVGSQFLIRADNYTDLILNSVALAFLIEIDNMMFVALIGSRPKRVVDSVEPLVIRQEETGNAKFDNVLHTLFYSLAVVFTVAALVANSYLSRGGKLEFGASLDCLCQLQGEMCWGRHMLGGIDLRIFAPLS